MANPNPDTRGLDPSHLKPAKPGERRAAKDRVMDAREAFRLYSEEKKLIAQAAKSAKVKKNEWMRSALVAAAKKELKK